MKKQLLIAVSALFLTVGAANAQIVVRIGPPPPRPVEVVPRRHTRVRCGSPAITAGTATATSGLPEPPPPPHRGAVWVPGEWREERGGHVWHAGYWK